MTSPKIASTRFWEDKRPDEMSPQEWESLCDGCGKCCLVKLQDEDTDRIAFTNVACKQLDCDTCLCKNYEQRLQLVPDCLVLTNENLPSYVEWLPASCAYKRLYEGKGLPAWHHLLTGSRDLMHKRGLSGAGKVVSEEGVADCDLEDHVVAWAGD